MSTEIETPEAMARRLDRQHLHVGEGCALVAIRADREQIATWCTERAEAAANLAANEANEADMPHLDGQAYALRKVAAILRGTK